MQSGLKQMTIVVVLLGFVAGCASRTQTEGAGIGAAAGAGVGAILGQAIGRNTTSTLLSAAAGAAAGGIGGAIVGGHVDNKKQPYGDAETRVDNETRYVREWNDRQEQDNRETANRIMEYQSPKGISSRNNSNW